MYIRRRKRQKKYVKELIYDLLYKEYGVNEINISKSNSI